MAFTLLSVKMYVILNVLCREHYPMCFAVKCSSFALYVTFLTAIPSGFAFNHTVLHLSCVFFASKIYANVWQILQISKFVDISQG